MGDEIATLRAEYQQMSAEVAKALSDLGNSLNATLEKTRVSQNSGSVVEVLKSECEEAVTSDASESAEHSKPVETMEKTRNAQERDSSELMALRSKLYTYQRLAEEARKHREKDYAEQLADYAEQLAKERLEKSQLREELERKDAEMKIQREETKQYLNFVNFYRESEVKCKRKDEENRALEKEIKQLQDKLAEYEERITDLEGSVQNLQDVTQRSQLAMEMLQDKLYNLRKENDELVETIRCLSADISACTIGGASSPGHRGHPRTSTPVVRPLWNESSEDGSCLTSTPSLHGLFHEP